MQVEEFLHHLKDGARKPAIVSDSATFFYTDLHQRVMEYSRELARQLVQDSCVMLVDNYSMESICMLFALWMHNNVVALAAPKHAHQIDALARSAGAAWVISGGASAGFAMMAQPPSPVPPHVEGLLSRRQAGFIVFSSGSTGPAKGVVHRVSPFLERYVSAEKCGAILAFLLFDHIGGLVTALHALASHGTLVIPQERSPQEVGRCIACFGVETLHVSPTLLNLAVLAGVFQQWDTQSLRRIYYGTEPSSPDFIKKMQTVLPGVELRQLYGMSEIGVLPCRSKDGNSAWMRVEDQHYSIKVVDGILHVRGKTNMAGYLSGNAAYSADGYFITEDLAEEDEGFFRVTGRAVDVINVGGKKVFPSDVERVLMDVNNVADVVVYGQPNALLGQIVAARFTLSTPEELVQFKTKLYQNIRGVLSPEQLPRLISISATPLHTSRFKKIRNPGAVAAS